MKIESFEDLIAWQEARRLTRLIYQLTSGGRMNTEEAKSVQQQIEVVGKLVSGLIRNSRKQLAVSVTEDS